MHALVTAVYITSFNLFCVMNIGYRTYVSHIVLPHTVGLLQMSHT